MDTEFLRQQLLARKAELLALGASVADTGQPVELDQARVGRLSRMDALQAQQMALESGRRRQLQLQKIEGALRRMASGDYGCCFICGEEINANRLTVDPTSTRCVNCVEA